MKDITDMEKDRQYMKMALELAQKGMGFTAPNPMVGAVIVKSGKVIGQGYHRKKYRNSLLIFFTDLLKVKLNSSIK